MSDDDTVRVSEKEPIGGATDPSNLSTTQRKHAATLKDRHLYMIAMGGK